MEKQSKSEKKDSDLDYKFECLESEDKIPYILFRYQFLSPILIESTLDKFHQSIVSKMLEFDSEEKYKGIKKFLVMDFRRVGLGDPKLAKYSNEFMKENVDRKNYFTVNFTLPSPLGKRIVKKQLKSDPPNVPTFIVKKSDDYKAIIEKSLKGSIPIEMENCYFINKQK
jgi:hypothetical protein